MNINIRELDLDNSPLLLQALDMMNRTQGVGLFKLSYLEDKIKREDAIALGAFFEDELIGVGCAEMIYDFSYYEPFEEGIQLRLKNKRVGSLCSLCVKESLQGKGIGQKLSKNRLDWLEEKKCNVIIGIAWLSGLSHTSDRVFQKLGFNEVSEIKEFFKESTKKYPFHCPGCQVQPCICSAKLYQLKIGTA